MNLLFTQLFISVLKKQTFRFNKVVLNRYSYTRGAFSLSLSSDSNASRQSTQCSMYLVYMYMWRKLQVIARNLQLQCTLKSSNMSNMTVQVSGDEYSEL